MSFSELCYLKINQMLFCRGVMHIIKRLLPYRLWTTSGGLVSGIIIVQSWREAIPFWLRELSKQKEYDKAWPVPRHFDRKPTEDNGNVSIGLNECLIMETVSNGVETFHTQRSIRRCVNLFWEYSVAKGQCFPKLHLGQPTLLTFSVVGIGLKNTTQIFEFMANSAPWKMTLPLF